MKRGLYLAPFDELADPRLVAELARAAESVDPRERGRLLDEGLEGLAGATWVLTGIDPQPPEPEIRAVVDAGP